MVLTEGYWAIRDFGAHSFYNLGWVSLGFTGQYSFMGPIQDNSTCYKWFYGAMAEQYDTIPDQ